MGKHIVVLKGSPRERGNSAGLAEALAAGAKEVEAEVESFYLHSMDIRPCDACDLCRENENGCVIDDDMQLLYPKLLQADAIVIASPVYWFTLNAQTKLCIDRWYAFGTSQGNALAGKQFGVILTYGDIDPYASGAINAIRTYQDMIRYLKADLVDLIYASATDPGDVQKQPELMESAFKLGQRLGAANI
jgi:multimeric flavodoxin WrbA